MTVPLAATAQRSHVRALVACALAVILAVAPLQGARASDAGGGCGTPKDKTSTGSVRCHLFFRGFPVTVFAESQTSGTAEVRVWVTLTELEGTPVTIAECTSRASGYASCTRSVPDDTTKVDHAGLAVATLSCNAQIKGTGRYYCVSGSGR